MKTLLFTLLFLIAGFWGLSYCFYTVIARQAYSGASTELFTFDGRLVFFDFNKYGPSGPPRQFGFSLNKRGSSMAERIRMEFSTPSPWSGTSGFTFILGKNDPEYGH